MTAATGYYRCLSDALEKPYALYQPFPFPQENAVFTVKVDGTDQPASYVSHVKWGDSLQQPGVGTRLADPGRRGHAHRARLRRRQGRWPTPSSAA